MEIILRLAPWILIIITGNCQQDTLYPFGGGGPSREMTDTGAIVVDGGHRETLSLGSLFREPIDAGGIGGQGIDAIATTRIPIDFGGIPHDPVDNVGGHRIPIDFGGIPHDPVDNFGGHRTPIDFGGIPHDPVDNVGGHRTPIDFGGIPHDPVDNVGGHRTPIDFGGIPHDPVDNFGRHRTPIDFGGIPHDPVDNVGAHRTPIDFGGIPHDPVDNVGGHRTPIDFGGIPHDPVDNVGGHRTPIDFGGIPSDGGNRGGLRRQPIDAGGRRIPIDNGGIPSGSVMPRLPPCPDVICTLQFIPEPCRQYQTITRNGKSCSGCPQRIPGCNEKIQDAKPGITDIPNAMPKSPHLVACPLLACVNNSIPQECEHIETYDYYGRTCEKCPVWRPACSVTNRTPDIACPILDCIQIHIEQACREETYFEHRGRQCHGCPRWKAGCTPSFRPDSSRTSGIVSPMSCPMLQCPEQIPAQCQVPHTVMINGRTCALCPTWSDMCRTASGPSTEERPPMACPLLQCQEVIPPHCWVQQTSQFNGQVCPACPIQTPKCNVDTTFGRVTCPMLACPRIHIPDECKDESPYMFQGNRCFGCPKWRPGCGGRSRQTDNTPDFSNWINNRIDVHEEIVCPLINCHPLNVPSECIQHDYYIFRGRQCLKCPSINTNCFILNQPRGFANIDVRQINQQRRVVCPTFACTAIYIPPECRLETPYDFQGQTCYGCPQEKPGCQATGSSVETATLTENISNMANDVSCPAMKCPYILIPPECRVEQTYDFNGRTCTACPVWRNGCRSNIGIGNSGVTCPSIPCPRIYIPPECKYEETFNFQGQTCYGCPKWRNGCVPGMGLPKADIACPIIDCQPVTFPVECAEDATYTFQGKTCVGCKTFREGCSVKQTRPDLDIGCPKVGCTAITISPECREETTYIFQGKLCKGCLRTKEGCVPGQGPDEKCPEVVCPLVYIPPDCKDERPYEFKGKICYKCPEWKPSCRKGHVVVEPASTSCPILDCGVSIPDECIEKQFHQFNGKTCQMCPKWRQGCVPKIPVRLVNTPGNRHTSTEVTCPVTKCNKRYIPPECKDTPSYDFNGKTCFMCPIWRNGCLSHTTGRGNGLGQPIGNDLTKPVRLDIPNIFFGIRNTGVAGSWTTQNDVCPELPCNRGIPVHCQRVTTYDYNGMTCPGCPIYNARCLRNGPNMNGLIAFRMFNELMLQ